MLTPFSAAEIVVLPELALVARPWALITATFTFAELQAACVERFIVVPSSKVPVATKACVVPRVILGLVGEMLSETSVAFVTVSAIVPTCPANTAEMVDAPGATPVAKPLVPAALLTVATEAVEDVHVTADVKSWELPSANDPIAANPAMICCGMVKVDGLTVMEVKAADSTNTMEVPANPPMDAVMVAVPADCPVA